jgi:hypothetical protein
MANITPNQSIAEIGYCYVYIDWNLLFELYGSVKIVDVTAEIHKFLVSTFPGQFRWEGVVTLCRCSKKRAKELFDELREENVKRAVPVPLLGFLYSTTSLVLDSRIGSFFKRVCVDPVLYEVRGKGSNMLECIVPLQSKIQLPAYRVAYIVYTKDKTEIVETIKIINDRVQVIYGFYCLAANQPLLRECLQSRYLDLLACVWEVAVTLRHTTVVNHIARKQLGTEFVRQPRLSFAEPFYTINVPTYPLSDMPINVLHPPQDLAEIRLELRDIRDHLALTTAPQPISNIYPSFSG